MAGQGGPNLDCIQVGGSSFKSNGQLEARGELIAMPPSFRGGVVQSIMSSSLKSSASKRLAGISGHINGSLTSQLSTSTTSTNHSSSQNSKQGESTRWTNPNNYRFWLPIQTRWSDNDAYGHMNNTKYYELFDTIVNKYLREECREKVPSMGLVVHSSCSYLQPIGFPSPVILGLGVEKIGKSSVIWRIGLWSTTTPNKTSPPTPESVVNQHQLIRDDSMGCIAFGQFVHVFVDHSSRSKIEISPVVRLGASRLLDENLAEK
ncbi:hypothetical protein MJO28_012876 [Puccinia striiformis f. sp. tritici]|uniref:Uncharacterized protein n=1 Tax=Puccinia striiformis f. sp. tritici TaxID=168172 RepID=A0ACC0DX53_9BASI|nr:hypothetical protein MJO28_012876 [Puccinia striiformis f. sp. tritici]KAI7943353.1 hypothetical protein MJO29_013197 [Puccinia striiformis f. sp. tritici]